MTTSFQKTLFTGKVVHRLDETVSTNMYASLLLQQGNADEGTIVIAKNQTAGRGYAGNTWESEPGKNLLFSIIYKPHFLKVKQQFFLSQAVALGVHDALNPITGKGLQIKWPNDLVFNGNKICGLLIENSVAGNWLQSSVIGIGLNVNQTKFSSGLIRVSSLRKITGQKLESEKIFECIGEHIEARYLQLRRNELQQLQKDYMNSLFQLEEDHYYKTSEGKICARIVGLNPEGKLILEFEGGWKPYGFKEVEYLK